MSLNPLQMPLIYDCHDIFCLDRIQLSENSFVSLINENSLLMGSCLAK
jgi:hypothetical protein